MSRTAAIYKLTPTQLPTIYVSTTLEFWQTMRGDCYGRDTVINGTPYRKLDSEYYAWLRDRLNRVKTRLDQGKFSAKAYDNLRQRFNRVYQWAVTQFSEAALVQAVQTFDPNRYQPPKPINADCFQGVRELPTDQQDWPPALRDIWNEIVKDLTGFGVPQEEAQTVAQGIVDSLVGKTPAIQSQTPVQTALPL